MSNLFPWCWHKWGRWSSPSNGIFADMTYSVGHFSVCQLRECEKCGKAQYRKLPKVRRIAGLKDER